MVAALSERAADVHSGNVDPSVDNMLKITSDGRKLGLDQRIINPNLPDDPEKSQLINIASLILGQNGIWGDLLNISENGVALFNKVLTVYKRVRDDITEAYPHVIGTPGATFEVHEKLNNGRGAIVLFGNVNGTYEYRVHGSAKTDNITVFGNVKVEDDNGLTLHVTFGEHNCAIVFFE